MAVASDFAEEAWVLTHDSTPRMVENGEGIVRARRVGSNYAVDVQTRTGCRIVISEASWPGWRACIDGLPVNVEQANRAFLSVYVPQGKHRVRVIYMPDAFVKGRAISLGSLFFLTVGIGLRKWRGPSKRSSPV